MFVIVLRVLSAEIDDVVTTLARSKTGIDLSAGYALKASQSDISGDTGLLYSGQFGRSTALAYIQTRRATSYKQSSITEHSWKPCLSSRVQSWISGHATVRTECQYLARSHDSLEPINSGLNGSLVVERPGLNRRTHAWSLGHFARYRRSLRISRV